MKENKKKVIVILGQTSTGKSDLAVWVAKHVLNNNAEIISADSRQVYKGLNLGTGKITKNEMRGVPHHMLDVVSPKAKFTVTQFKKRADKKIQEILTRGNTPILCGGTGFYIDAIVNNIVFPDVPPNEKLRKSLGKWSSEKLFAILMKLDKSRAKDIKSKNEIQNKVRLIRAIEIATYVGKVPRLAAQSPSEYTFIKIGLLIPDEKLREKIKIRLLKRLKQGMLKEAITLHKKGLTYKRMRELGLEYRFMALYLEKKVTKVEMVEKLTTEIIHYAKRQRTWFKRDTSIKWFRPSDTNAIRDVIMKALTS
jgi:tRNA dimethylallyltransferase